jgi:hypothetical protein
VKAAGRCCSISAPRAVLAPGYAPLEQYSGDGRIGPWSDLYALAAVLYRALTGEDPPQAASRTKNDPVAHKLAAARGRAREPFPCAVHWGLALDARERPQSIAERRRALVAGEPAPLAVRVAPTADPDGETRPPVAQGPTGFSGKHAVRWRGAGIGVVLVVLALAASAWNKQRAANEHQERETARFELERKQAERHRIEEQDAQRRVAGSAAREQERALRQAEEEHNREKLAGKAPPLHEPRSERPTRERGERPGESEAEELRRKVQDEFRAADANGDGYLERGEVRGRMPLLEQAFDRFDADGDGRLSLDEFTRFRRALRAPRLPK